MHLRQPIQIGYFNQSVFQCVALRHHNFLNDELRRLTVVTIFYLSNYTFRCGGHWGWGRSGNMILSNTNLFLVKQMTIFLGLLLVCPLLFSYLLCIDHCLDLVLLPIISSFEVYSFTATMFNIRHVFASNSTRSSRALRNQ